MASKLLFGNELIHLLSSILVRGGGLESVSKRKTLRMTEVSGRSNANWVERTVLISNLPVADASEREVVRWLAVRRNPGKPLLAYALHIGGMVHLQKNPSFRATLLNSSLLYADGIGPVLVGRASGGRLERSPTTDIAPALLAEWAASGSTPRIALVGGPDGLARSAGDKLEREGLGTVVFESNGYLDSWDDALQEVRQSEPDILFVGMGAPREMEWCERYQLQLPNCVVMTCGGWFGFLAGQESRAPKWVQRCGGEWMWRLAQNPRRLFKRYARGLGVLSRALVSALIMRR